MKSAGAPGDKAKNSAHRGEFSSGAAIANKDFRERRASRGKFAHSPNPGQVLSRGRHKSFDVGGSMSGGKKIPTSRTQKTA